jgi:hypothetical protein
LPPTEPQIKWTGKEEECLAKAWKTISMNSITSANQNYDTYWQRVKFAFDERKIVDPYFNKTVMIHGEKAMCTHWGIMQAACSGWHGIQEEIEARRESGADFEAKVCSLAVPSIDPASPSFHFDSEACLLQMRMWQAFDMYSDDTDGQTFKYLNVFACIDNCEK